MFRHMLIPIDGSECSFAALHYALPLAAGLRCRITLLTVTRPFPGTAAEAERNEALRADFEQYERDRGDRYLDWGKAIVQDSRLACDTLRVTSRHPYAVIIATARDRHCDVIAMGSHGLGGVKALILGSVTQKVLTHCDVPVLVYR